MKRILIALSVFVLICAGVALTVTHYAVAQDEESGRFVRFVERQISTPDRQIDLGPIQGALSSDVRIRYITIADQQGVWLRLDNVHMVWSRFALLRGRLNIDLLEAESITVTRTPQSEGDDEPLDDGPREFEVPSLPVSVRLDELKVPRVEIAEGIIGPAAALSVDGSIRLADGELETDLAIDRLDRGGALKLEASFSNSSRQLAIDLSLSEPEDGVIANALSIEGRPPIEFTVSGEGPLDDYVANIGLVADGQTLVSGTTEIDNTGDGLRFRADIKGNLEVLVPDLYQPFVGGGSEIVVDFTRAQSGAINISEGRLTSGVAQLNFTADIGADMVPTALTIDGSMERQDGQPIALPGGGGADTIGSATISASLGGGSDAFSLDIEVEDLDTGAISAPRATIRASGTATNLGAPQDRAVTFDVTGGASGMGSDKGSVRDALGSALDLRASGSWRAGEPVTVQNAALNTETVEFGFSGTILDAVTGRLRLKTDDLSAFAAIASRDLSGAVDIAADGRVAFDGMFDLTLDGTATNVRAGIDAVDGLMEGRTTLSGRAARSATGFSFNDFSLDNPQLSLNADGRATTAEADLQVRAALTELSRIDERFEGGIAATLAVTGDPATPKVVADISSDSLTLNGQTLTGLSAAFDGRYTRSETVPMDLDGRLTVTGSLDGRPVDVTTTLQTEADSRSLNDLSAQIAGASLAGNLTLRNDGLATGRLDVDVPDIARLADLALQEASGAIDALVTLSVDGERQVVAIDGNARDVAAAGVSLAEADLDLVVDNVTGIPTLDGRANLRALKVADYEIVTATLTADRRGETSELALDADLGTGTLATTGALTRAAQGFTARVDTLRLARGGFEAELQAPTRVDVGDQQITIANTALTIGEGDLTVAGTVGDTLDLSVRADNLPLRIANLVVPDLQAAGTVSGSAQIGGTRPSPTVTAQVQAEGVTAKMLSERGIEPLTMNANGSYADGTATLQQFQTSVGGGEITASGTVGETLDVTASVRELPLALANAVQPELDVSGTLSGTVSATGTLKAPNAQFDVRVAGANAKPLREAGLEPLNATAVGTFADGTAQIRTFETTVGGGRIVVTGQIGQSLDVRAFVVDLPLALAEAVAPDLDATGTLTGEVSATGTLDDPNATFNIEVQRASVAPLRASGIDPLYAIVRGSFAGRTATLDEVRAAVGSGTVDASGTVGERLDLSVRLNQLPLGLANGFAPGLGLSGTLSGEADVSGELSDPAADFSLRLANASARMLDGANVGTVAANIEGRYADGLANLSTARITLGQGTVTATGRAGPDQLDITATLDQLPLAVANAFVPEMGVGGTLSGRVTAQGRPTDPRVTFEVNAPAVTARPLRDGGYGAGAVEAAGTYRDGTVTLTQATARIGGGVARAQGTVGQRLNLSVDLTNVPLGIANGFAPGVGLSGTLSGTATAEGSIANPRARFDVSGANVSANALRDAGVGALSVAASGSYGNGGVDIASARASGSGLDVNARGFVPLSGGGLDISVDANAPLSLANQFLAERGTRLSGDVVANIRATGSLANPNATGTVRASGFSVRDPQSNLVLENGQLVANLNGNSVQISQLSASLGDGTVSISGTVGLGAGFPADLRFVANNARYADGQLFAVTFNADLSITGPLTAGPTVVGRVGVDRAEITVPTRLSGTAALLEVAHFNTPPPVMETLRRARAGPFADVSEGDGSGASGLTLDVTVDAPARIFVRGRGIDAELGGQVRITGPISDIQPVGQFQLIRGRVNILTQRINLNEGEVTLLGDLDPVIRLVAETSRGDVTVRIIVDGPATDPAVRFESSPELPQDEVLSQLIFGRSVDDLSAFQLAQLAAAVAELAGVGNGPSIIDQVRAFSGLDNLEIVTTESGDTAVEAGRYIADNVYVGVRAGAESTGVSVNLEITKSLKARAEAYTDESAVGLYFEREY